VNANAADLWRRAAEALLTARHDLAVSPDAAASRAYYAAFDAASALFALEDQSSTKHSAVEAAVHRDLVKAGRWAEILGKNCSFLAELRETGDYGGGQHVSRPEAEEAIAHASSILEAVRAAASGEFDAIES